MKKHINEKEKKRRLLFFLNHRERWVHDLIIFEINRNRNNGGWGYVLVTY